MTERVTRPKKLSTIAMPTTLTAENGAKALMIGEFQETVERECPSCTYEKWDESCDICQGQVCYSEKVTIGWSTIKAIYSKLVWGRYRNILQQ